MKNLYYVSICLLGWSLYAGEYVSPHATGEYDEQLQCIVDRDGLCETGSIDGVLELCKDCEITVPEKAEVSDFEAWCRSVGIKLYYAYDESSSLELALYGTGIIVSGYLISMLFKTKAK